MIVGLVAAGLLVLGAVFAARRITRQANDDARHLSEGIIAEAKREAEARSQSLLAAAQEKALAGEEEADRRERDLDAREAEIETRARQRDNELAAVERQRKDLERRQAVVAGAEERTRQIQSAAEKDRGEARGASRGGSWSMRPSASA
jgi:ribonucrease Y